ncbi:MAG: type II toxin-antitoxin system Phd/YefM family antitoxin [Chloroflexota bacterium]
MAKRAVVTASELRRSSGKILKRVAVAKDHLVVEREGYPVAVMMPFEEYEQLMRERALMAHRDLAITLGKEAERKGLTEEQLMEELEASKRRVYEDRYS